MFSGIGTTELLIIALIILILFGGKKLPELGKSLGEAIKELRGSIKGDDEEEDKKKTE